MATSGISAVNAYQVQSAQQTQKVKPQEQTAKNGTATLATPSKPKTDTVTISQQAQTLLNSKGYSPAEENSEAGYEKTYEKSLGQR